MLEYYEGRDVVFAVDQSIGEPSYWGRGIGSSFLRLMSAFLKEAQTMHVILLDPHKSNLRAITAYE